MDECIPKWSADTVKMKFDSQDTASDEYRAKPTGKTDILAFYSTRSIIIVCTLHSARLHVRRAPGHVNATRPWCYNNLAY